MSNGGAQDQGFKPDCKSHIQSDYYELFSAVFLHFPEIVLNFLLKFELLQVLSKTSTNRHLLFGVNLSFNETKSRFIYPKLSQIITP